MDIAGPPFGPLHAIAVLEFLKDEKLPATPTPEEARPFFVALRKLRDELQDRNGLVLHGLSMGMSHDFEIAIEEGSTIVRVGSAIFGPRRAWDGNGPSPSNLKPA